MFLETFHGSHPKMFKNRGQNATSADLTEKTQCPAGNGRTGNPKKGNKMKPTNPNADTYVDEQKQYLFVTFSSEPTLKDPELTH